MKTVIALMTCHNRREKTLAAIEAYFQCVLPMGVERQLVLVDDGSRDGTREAVLARWPQVTVHYGDGSLFWNRGMLQAWKIARDTLPAGTQADFVLWLNDDTLLNEQALVSLFEAYQVALRKTSKDAVIVGATHDAHGKLSYGGAIRQGRLNPLKFKKIAPTQSLLKVDTMNGNCVLVPSAVFADVGLLDERFHHNMGDTDYGLRVSRAGWSVWQAPDYVGMCGNDNVVSGSFNDTSLPLSVRWKKMISPKGVPLRPWGLLCWRHGGLLWPLVFVWPYARLVLSALVSHAGAQAAASSRRN